MADVNGLPIRRININGKIYAQYGALSACLKDPDHRLGHHRLSIDSGSCRLTRRKQAQQNIAAGKNGELPHDGLRAQSTAMGQEPRMSWIYELVATHFPQLLKEVLKVGHHAKNATDDGRPTGKGHQKQKNQAENSAPQFQPPVRMVIVRDHVKHGMRSESRRRAKIDVARQTTGQGSGCKVGEDAHRSVLLVIRCLVIRCLASRRPALFRLHRAA